MPLKSNTLALLLFQKLRVVREPVLPEGLARLESILDCEEPIATKTFIVQQGFLVVELHRPFSIVILRLSLHHCVPQ